MNQSEASDRAQEKVNATGKPHYVALWWDEEEKSEVASIHDHDPACEHDREVGDMPVAVFQYLPEHEQKEATA